MFDKKEGKKNGAFLGKVVLEKLKILKKRKEKGTRRRKGTFLD